MSAINMLCSSVSCGRALSFQAWVIWRLRIASVILGLVGWRLLSKLFCRPLHQLCYSMFMGGVLFCGDGRGLLSSTMHLSSQISFCARFVCRRWMAHGRLALLMAQFVLWVSSRNLLGFTYRTARTFRLVFKAGTDRIMCMPYIMLRHSCVFSCYVFKLVPES